MASVLLVDADSVIPNLALMKLSGFHRKLGDSISFMRLSIPYYPSRKKVAHRVVTASYDKVYCSVVFDGTIDYVGGDGIVFGGTGYSLETVLEEEVESTSPDYSLYPDNDISYGFLSRGCIRNCEFCKSSSEGRYYTPSSIC